MFILCWPSLHWQWRSLKIVTGYDAWRHSKQDLTAMSHHIRITIKQSCNHSDVINLTMRDGTLHFSYEEPERTACRLECKFESSDILSSTAFFYKLGAFSATKKAVFPLVDVALFIQDPKNAINVCRERLATRRQFDQYFHPRDHKHNLSSLLQHLMPAFYKGYRENAASIMNSGVSNKPASN